MRKFVFVAVLICLASTTHAQEGRGGGLVRLNVDGKLYEFNGRSKRGPSRARRIRQTSSTKAPRRCPTATASSIMRPRASIAIAKDACGGKRIGEGDRR